MEQMKSAAKSLEHQLEQLYITITAVSVVSCVCFAAGSFWRFGWSSFGVIMAAGLALIILIVSSGILDYKKNKYKSQILQQLLECQKDSELQCDNKLADSQQNQPVMGGVKENEPNNSSSSSLCNFEKVERNQNVATDITEKGNVQSNETALKVECSDDSEQIQSVTRIFVNFLSENSQEYELSLALFKDVKAVRKSLFAKPD